MGRPLPAVRAKAFQILMSSFTSEGILRIIFSLSLNSFRKFKIGRLKNFFFAKGLSCTIDSHLLGPFLNRKLT